MTQQGAQGSGSNPSKANGELSEQIAEVTNASGGELLHELAEHRHDPNFIARSFRSREYPYKSKITRKTYDTRKKEMQVELLKVQK